MLYRIGKSNTNAWKAINQKSFVVLSALGWLLALSVLLLALIPSLEKWVEGIGR